MVRDGFKIWNFKFDVFANILFRIFYPSDISYTAILHIFFFPHFTKDIVKLIGYESRPIYYTTILNIEF